MQGLIYATKFLQAFVVLLFFTAFMLLEVEPGVTAGEEMLYRLETAAGGY